MAAILVGGMLVSSGCGTRPSQPPPTPVTVQLRWTHSAQSAGFYAAQQMGLYARENLAVTFVEGGPTTDIIGHVVDGQAQFGVINADALIAASSQSKPVLAIAAIYRRSPTVYMALGSSGITRPRDFAGKTISVAPGGRATLATIARRDGVLPDQYTVVPPSSDLARFYSGQVQVWVSFIMDQPQRARQAGYEVNLIYPDDYGIHFYADTLFVRPDLAERDPGLVTRFLRATLQGWTFATEHPETVAGLVRKYNPGANTEQETQFFDSSVPLISTGEDHIGWIKPETWAGMRQTLLEQGAITAPDASPTYTLSFLNAIYGPR